MSHRLRLAFLLPLSLLFAVVLFVLPDFDLGIPGGLAVVVCAWVVWISTWVSLLRVQPGDMIGALLICVGLVVIRLPQRGLATDPPEDH